MSGFGSNAPSQEVAPVQGNLWRTSPFVADKGVHGYVQELKALTDVLEATPFAFALELAALAARREYLNLEKWLQERMAAHGLPFMQVGPGPVMTSYPMSSEPVQ